MEVFTQNGSLLRRSIYSAIVSFISSLFGLKSVGTALHVRIIVFNTRNRPRGAAAFVRDTVPQRFQALKEFTLIELRRKSIISYLLRTGKDRTKKKQETRRGK